MVLGHETSGYAMHAQDLSCTLCMTAESRCAICREVVAVGDNVRQLHVGDRVALEPGIPCWGVLLRFYCSACSRTCWPALQPLTAHGCRQHAAEVSTFSSLSLKPLHAP